MAKKVSKRYFEINFGILVVFLVGMLTGLFYLTAVCIRAGRSVEGYQNKDFIIHLAWISAGLAGATLVLLVWSVFRFVRRRVVLAEPNEKESPPDAKIPGGKPFQLRDDESSPSE